MTHAASAPAGASVQAQRELPAVRWPMTLLALFVVIIDGFDLLAIAFGAPGITREWQLDLRVLGLLLGLGPAGMGVGSVFLAPLADRFGRRPVVLIGLSCVLASMVLAACAQSVAMMAVARIATGLGVGALTPVLNALAVENAPAKRRSLVISIIAAGMPIGTAIGGALSIPVLAAFGWRGVFATGAILSTVSLLLAYLLVRETAEFIAGAGRPRSREPIAQRGVLARLKNLNGDEDFLGRTMLICALSFLTQFSLFFVLQWIPKILSDAGLHESHAVGISVMLSFGGIIGALGFGLISRPRFEHALTAALMTIAFGLIFLLALTQDLFALRALALIVGITLYAVGVGMFTIIIGAYPARTRVTGMGLSVGIGRIGAVLGPVSAGFLMAHAWPRTAYFPILAAPLLIAAFIVLRVRDRARRAAPVHSELHP